MKDYPDRMSPEQARAFRDAVLNIVSQIPRGRVTTYGHIAALAGWPSTAPGWSRQRTLLEEEGVRFKPNGHVDMARHLWEPPIEI